MGEGVIGEACRVQAADTGQLQEGETLLHRGGGGSLAVSYRGVPLLLGVFSVDSLPRWRRDIVHRRHEICNCRCVERVFVEHL